MSSTVTVPLGWDVGIEIPTVLARRSPGLAVEQRIDFRFVNVAPRPLAPPTHQMRYDWRGKVLSPARRGNLLDERS